MSKDQEEYSHSYPKVKRRRMLQFDSQPMDTSLCCTETSSAFPGSDVSLRNHESLSTKVAWHAR